MFSHFLTVDKVQPYLHIVIDACEVQTLADTLVGILQVVFAHERHMDLTVGFALLVEEVVPGSHGGCLANRNTYLAEDGCIEPLALHAHRHLVDGGHILALHHALEIDITKRRHLHAQGIVEVALSTQNEDIGLYAHPLQFFHGVLGWLGLQLFCSLQVRHVGKMHADRIAPQLPAQLSDGLHKRCTLDVANGAAHFSDDKVELLALYVLAQHAPLDLVGDMRHHLNRLAQIVAMTLTIDDRLVDTSCGDRVVTGGVNARKPFVMSQIEIGLETILRHVALTMLIGIECAWIDVDIGVELLDSDLIAACLQQLADAGGDDTLTK